MEFDIEQLIVLIQERPALYDYSRKDYTNLKVTTQLWEEIARELNTTVEVCRMKWRNLRSCYTRYFRDIKKMQCGSGSFKRKKKWYLADAMSFLDNYTRPSNKTASYTEEEESEVEDASPSHSKSHPSSTSLRLSLSNKEEEESEVKETFKVPSSSHSKTRPSCASLKCSLPNKKHTTAEVVEAPITKFLDSLSESRMKERESPFMNFFLGVLPDIEKLAPKRQRMFKAELVQLVNKLVDEEEEENALILSSPTPKCGTNM